MFALKQSKNKFESVVRFCIKTTILKNREKVLICKGLKVMASRSPTRCKFLTCGDLKVGLARTCLHLRWLAITYDYLRYFTMTYDDLR